ncbi:hypothetical protein BH09PAT1_BH09PAT1_0570 [soil metagenome]
MNYSTRQVSQELVNEIVEALGNIRGWGSIEIYVQNHEVVQITERNIRKTSSSSSKDKTVKIGS